MRHCEECGAEIPPQQGPQRPRKFCKVCRPPRNRPNPRLIHLPDTPAAAPAREDDPEPVEPAMVARYRQRLEAAGRLDTDEGQHVMHLATLLASGTHTASGAAALSKELWRARDEALRDAPRAADAVDELEERRNRKASSA